MARAPGAAAPARLQLGLDLLGPKRARALPMLPMAPRPLLLTAQAAPSQADTAAAPGQAVAGPSQPAGGAQPASDELPVAQPTSQVEALTELLSWCTITQEQASARATQLLVVLHDLTEEACKSRLTLKHYKDRDEYQAKASTPRQVP